jgi:hypothetical protein
MKKADRVISVRDATCRSTMYAVLALSLAASFSFAACAPAKATSIHRATPERYRAPRLVIPPSHGAASQAQFAVPGWSDEETRRWLDNASSAWSQA